MLASLPALLLTFPLVAAVLVWLIPRRWSRIAAGGGALAIVLLAIYLTSLPLDLAGAAGNEWTLWGLSWRLTAGTWAVVRLLYAGTAFLFLLAIFWPQEGEFVAAGLAALSPLVASLMLPFSLGAVALFLASLALVIVVHSGRQGAGRAPLRYFLLSALALPFLLLAAWMIASEQLVFAGLIWRLLLAGLILLLAGFPFHIWVRPLASVAPPLALPFLFGLAQLPLLIFAFQLLPDTILMEGEGRFQTLLGWSGVATAITGAILTYRPPQAPAASGEQRRADARAVSGALLLIALGQVLVALSLGSAGLQPALLLLFGRFLSLLLLLAGLALVPAAAATGALPAPARPPWSRLVFLYGAFSLLGLPLTPGFAGQWALLALAATRSLWLPLLLLLALAGASAGLLLYGRALLAPSTAPGPAASATVFPRLASLLLLVAGLVLALFPGPLLSLATTLATRLG